MNTEQIKQLAEETFNKYCAECGLDDDDVRAAAWYKHGMISYTEWMIENNLEKVAEDDKTILEGLKFSLDMIKEMRKTHAGLGGLEHGVREAYRYLKSKVSAINHQS